jgi:hypothetical protein
MRIVEEKDALTLTEKQNYKEIDYEEEHILGGGVDIVEDSDGAGEDYSEDKDDFLEEESGVNSVNDE